MTTSIEKVCVYCASSRQADPIYADTARQLGQLLAQHGSTVVYGGGAVGSMGALADGTLAAGGKVIGILPQFMKDLEWGHTDISDLRLVADMHERKRLMMAEADAIVALPGGSGTFEELLEAITWKRLGLYFNPIVLVNTRGYYDPLVTLFQNAVDQRFMDTRHLAMWATVNRVEDVIPAIKNAPPWSEGARGFAVV